MYFCHNRPLEMNAQVGPENKEKRKDEIQTKSIFMAEEEKLVRLQVNLIKCFLIMFSDLCKGVMGMSGDGMMSPDRRQKMDVKDDAAPTSEPHKPKVPP